MKGVVLKKKRKSYIVVTPNGEFLRTKTKENYQIGEEINFEQEDEIPSFNFFFKPQFMKLAVAMVMLFAVILPLHLLKSEDAYAYVTVDINPSVEMKINKQYEVVGIKGLNNDGKTLVREIKHWKKRDFNEVTKQVIKKAEEEGKLGKKREVLMSIAYKNEKEEKAFVKFEEKTREIETITKVEITRFEIQKDTREKAVKMKVSPNKLYISEESKKQGKAIEIENIRNKSVEEITEENKEVKKMLRKEKEQTKKPIEKIEQKQKEKNRAEEEKNQTEPAEKEASKSSDQKTKLTVPKNKETNTKQQKQKNKEKLNTTPKQKETSKKEQQNTNNHKQEKKSDANFKKEKQNQNKNSKNSEIKKDKK